MKKVIAWIGNNWKAILITVAVIIILWYAIKWTGLADEIKAKLKRPSKATDQNGGNGGDATILDDYGNAVAYDPRPDVIRLYNAMKGAGTDEDAIWDTLELKTNPQLTAIYNDFQKYTGESLFDWFNADLSGTDLDRATGYFIGTGISFT